MGKGPTGKKGKATTRKNGVKKWNRGKKALANSRRRKGKGNI